METPLVSLRICSFWWHPSMLLRLRPSVMLRSNRPKARLLSCILFITQSFPSRFLKSVLSLIFSWNYSLCAKDLRKRRTQANSKKWMKIRTTMMTKMWILRSLTKRRWSHFWRPCPKKSSLTSSFWEIARKILFLVMGLASSLTEAFSRLSSSDTSSWVAWCTPSHKFMPEVEATEGCLRTIMILTRSGRSETWDTALFSAHWPNPESTR